MTNCPICNSSCDFLTEKKDRFHQTYNYFVCKNCRFLFEKDLAQSPVALKQKVDALYGGDYFSQVDAGWQVRGDGFLKVMTKVLKVYKLFIRRKTVNILDYGAGNGYIASHLAGLASVFYYDTYEKPTFTGNYTILEKPQKADIMYAVELVEHVIDIKAWDFLKEVLPDIFIFTTCLSDNIGKKELVDWIYLNPDAGHMALYSTKSLYLLGRKYGFVYFFFPNISCHMFIKNKFLSIVNFVAVEYFFYNLLRKIIKK